MTPLVNETDTANGGGADKAALKVLMAPVNISGMPLVLVKGLREIGVDARLLQFGRGDQGHAFGYDSDIRVDLNAGPAGQVRFDTVRSTLDDGYDIFHFWLRTLVSGPGYSGLMGLDLPFIRLNGRKIVYRFTGMDLRDPEYDLEHNPHSPFRHGFVAASPEDEPIRQAYIDFLRCHVDQFVVQDPEMAQYMPDAKIVPRALTLENWEHVGIAANDVPLIVHGPSNPSVKGTKYILAACERLQEEGLKFELKLITGMAHQEAVEWYRRADIVIDQILIGAYGVLTMEAMALGKPVICYVREDLFEPHFGKLPIINANPDNIGDVIRATVKDFELRKEKGAAGRAFVEKHHDVRKVVPDLKAVYQGVMAKPPNTSVSGADLTFIGRQYGAMEKLISRHRALVRKNEEDRVDAGGGGDNRARLARALRGEREARKEADKLHRQLERLERRTGVTRTGRRVRGRSLIGRTLSRLFRRSKPTR